MSEYLRNDDFMRAHIRKVKFNWWGKKTDQGISALRDTSLQSLTVVISRLTMKEPSTREQILRRIFPRNRNKVGFPEALGFDELSALRDLTEVNVELATKKQVAEICSSEDKATLGHWLEQLKKSSKKD